ncbi:MAG TPA: oxidoreductase [Acidimicrobiales bacterium]|nr:oxidoreductase [Acidimicrobiales bacterium]
MNLGDTFVMGPKTVHRMGFGAMQLPGPGVFGPPRDRTEALAVLRRAVELGVDHIDTAQFYGPEVANQLIHEALHPYPAGLALVSKVGARRDDTGQWLPAQTPSELRAGVEDNLRTLAADQVDVVNLRLMEHPEVALEDQLGAMIQLRTQGMIGGIGLSNVTTGQLAEARAMTDIACVQNAFNVVDRSSEPVLDACRAEGIAFVPFFPLGSAFGGDHNDVLEAPAVVAAAGRLGATVAQVALAWLLGHAPNLLLIPGTSSRPHLEENLAAAAIELDGGTREELDAIGSAAGT